MFFADKYSEIPVGIVNKRLCGCGLSSFALENKNKTVLVVPNVSMIINKTSQYPNKRRTEEIFGMYGSSHNNTEEQLEALEEYISNTEIPKIMVTYDSFYKVRQYIDRSWHIVIDEFSDLLDAYGYRDKAINNLLNNLFIDQLKQKSIYTPIYPNTSFVSATPIKTEYLPEQLTNLPYTELEWENTIPVQVIPFNTNKPLTAVLNIIKKYKSGLVEVNGYKSITAYFYINSVKMIKDIIDKAGLVPSEVRVICANTKENERKLDLFDIETTIDPEKPFNFLTSTTFKGSDIYSDSGIAYVISNNQNIHTLLTIDTDIYQIAGRIRNFNNPFRNLVYHIFNENPLNLDEETFNTIINRKIRDTKEMIRGFTNTDIDKEVYLRNVKINCDENYLYLKKANSIYETDQLEFDYIKLAQERRVYECIIKVYQSGLNVVEAYKEREGIYEVVEDTDILNKNNSTTFLTGNNFKYVCKLVCEDKCNKEKVFKEYPLIKEGYEKLGIRRLKALGYDSSKIKNELLNLENRENINKYIKELFKSSTFYSSKDIKAKLNILYNNLGIKKKAKCTDIENILNISSSNKRINSKLVRGYYIP